MTLTVDDLIDDVAYVLVDLIDCLFLNSSCFGWPHRKTVSPWIIIFRGLSFTCKSTLFNSKCCSLYGIEMMDVLCFFRKGWKHKSNFIPYFFKSAYHGNYSHTARNVNIITRRIGISFEDVISRSDRWLKRRCRMQQGQPGWRDALLREFIMCRDGLL